MQSGTTPKGINQHSQEPHTNHCDITHAKCSTLATVQLIIIDLLHFLIIVLEVLVILLTLCVLELSSVICCHLHSPHEPRSHY